MIKECRHSAASTQVCVSRMHESRARARARSLSLTHTLTHSLTHSTCVAHRFQALCNSDDEQAKQREQEAFAQKVREMELAHQAQQARAKRGPGAASETVLVLALSSKHIYLL